MMTRAEFLARMKKPFYGECGSCGKSVRLRKDGTFQKHIDHWNGGECDGTGYEPTT